MLIAPLFLLGLLGLALPWWLHRLEMQTTEREKFATTRFSNRRGSASMCSANCVTCF